MVPPPHADGTNKDEAKPPRERRAVPPPPSSPPAEDTLEPVRCHLHRKPQQNCKICRRLHKDAFEGGLHKKDEHAPKGGGGSGSRYGIGESDILALARRRGSEPFEVSNKVTFNFNSMLRDQILKNTYFKTLMGAETFEEVVDHLYQYAETAEVYGAGTTTVPSTLFCCLFRMFTIGITHEELLQLLESRDNPYVRCCGFLYIRFGCASERLWDYLGEYCLDDQEFEPSRSTPGFAVSVGEYVEALLMDERYYYTALPRIPVGIKKKIEEKVAPLGQFRRRVIANKKALHLFREPGTLVEACSEGTWLEGHVVQVNDLAVSRILVRVKMEDGLEETLNLGKVILREERRRGARERSRSRSARRNHSPDWSRHRGQSQEQLVQELRARQRERAVCSTGKDYARKPVGFMSGLALKRDMGMASTRLREEETYAPRQVEHRKVYTEEDEMERRKEERVRNEMDREAQVRMQQLYEKYGSAHPPARPGGQQEEPAPDPAVEAPEVLRLG